MNSLKKKKKKTMTKNHETKTGRAGPLFTLLNILRNSTNSRLKFDLTESFVLNMIHYINEWYVNVSCCVGWIDETIHEAGVKSNDSISFSVDYDSQSQTSKIIKLVFLNTV